MASREKIMIQFPIPEKLLKAYVTPSQQCYQIIKNSALSQTIEK